MSGRFVLSCLIFLFVYTSGRTQVDLNDPLGSAFRISARSKVRETLKPGTSAVFFSGGFTGQAEHVVEPRPFLSNADFHYLTGLNTPDAVLVILQATMTLSEGQVSELLFLPSDHDQTLKLMGDEYAGKFGLHSGTLAIRPSTQWRKFCLEVLAADEMQTVYANPVAESDYRKRGTLAYSDLGSIFFNSLAPGFPFDPAAQGLYQEILRADTAALRILRPKADALLNYYPALRRDPIINAFSMARTPGDLVAVHAQIKAIKINVVDMQNVLIQTRLIKQPKEIQMIEKACKLAVQAMDWIATGKPAGRSERQLQAAAEYLINFKGGGTPVKAKVAAGRNAILPNYYRCDDTIPAKGNVVVDLIAEWKHYHARITRTLPAQGRFEGKDLELYSMVRGIHNSGIQACKLNVLPSHVLNEVQSDFEDAIKRLGITSSGTKGVSWVFDITSIGLDINEFTAPRNLLSGMVIVVETAIFIQPDKNVKEEWKNKAVVLRDVIQITDAGPQNLTSSFTTDPGGIDALLNRVGKLPLE